MPTVASSLLLVALPVLARPLLDPPPPAPLDRGDWPHPLPAVGSEGMQEDWDIEDYTLSVALDPDAREVDGTAAIRAAARVDDPGPLRLHASGPAVVDARSDGVPADWTEVDGEVRVDAPAGVSAGEVVDFEVSWTATGNSSTGLGLNWGDPIYSFHEPTGARKWLVIWDDPADKATVEWRVRVPADLVVAANGELAEVVDEGDGTRTWTFEFPDPIATYLMVVHAGTYEEAVDTGAPVPVHTVAPLPLLARAVDDFSTTGDAIALFSELFGDYPWTLYRNVLAPMPGAMEHTTATTFGTDMVGTGYAELVNVHELVHHWWGDWVTCENWAEIWLNEGFASYGEVLWVEDRWGADAAREYRAEQRDSYFAWQEWEGVGALYDPPFMWGGLVYDKGSLVLHMLRRVVGDEAFFEGLRAYGEAHGMDVATTEDLRAAAEAAWGADLSWFFDEWVYRAGDPSYVVGATATEREDGGWQLDLHVAQDGEETWRMPVDARVRLADGEEVVLRAWADGALATTSFCLDAEPVDVEFDPDGDLLYEEMERDDARFEPAAGACTGEPAGDTAEDGAAGPGVEEGGSASGCGCAAAGTGRRAGSALAVLVAALLPATRRQRRLPTRRRARARMTTASTRATGP